jgi:hypothetical protein
MAVPEESKPPRGKKWARKPKRDQPPLTISPAAKAESWVREHVATLEEDKRRLLAEVERLQARVDQLGPENALLREALFHTQTIDTVATALIAVGGFGVSYATFAGQSPARWANVAAGCLLAGIVMMLWQSLRRRRPS